MPVTIAAVGSHIPPGRLDNKEISRRIRDAGGVRVPPLLIDRYTGIRTRSLAAAGTNASDLAAAAVRDMESHYPGSSSDVDLLIFASASRDMVEPATAHAVADMLNVNAHCFDLTNACNSLINGIDVASAMIAGGRAQRALVVTGEVPSIAVRYNPRSTPELRAAFAGYTFGDAGAALLLTNSTHGGLEYVAATTHSQHWRIGGVFGGGTRHPRDMEHTYFTGEGPELKDAFEQIGTDLIDKMQQETGLTMRDFARVLVHQVTVPYLNRIAEVLEISDRQLVRTVDRFGNLASATLGVQLAEVHRQTRPGERILLLGLGGGISLQCAVWQAP